MAVQVDFGRSAALNDHRNNHPWPRRCSCCYGVIPRRQGYETRRCLVGSNSIIHMFDPCSGCIVNVIVRVLEKSRVVALGNTFEGGEDLEITCIEGRGTAYQWAWSDRSQGDGFRRARRPERNQG